MRQAHGCASSCEKGQSRLTFVKPSAMCAGMLTAFPLPERSMYKRILVPTDGSKLSAKAVTHAIGLARTMGARLIAFHASPDQRLAVYGDGFVVGTVPAADYKAAAAKAANKIFERVVREAGKASVECSTSHAIALEPWKAILDEAKKSKADAIVMASHGRRGVSALLVGSETQKVLTHSKLPVTVVR